MVKTKTYLLGFLLLLLLAVGALAVLCQRPAGDTAAVYLDGELIRRIDLSAVKTRETFDISCDGGSNTILVESGRICVLEADCPDQICVQSGWLNSEAAPIVCLPHRLVIRLESSEEDATGPDAAAK